MGTELWGMMRSSGGDRVAAAEQCDTALTIPYVTESHTAAGQRQQMLCCVFFATIKQRASPCIYPHRAVSPTQD